MYNRYIPQPDGSYRRNRCPDHAPRPKPQPPEPPSPPDPPCSEPEICCDPKPEKPNPRPQQKPKCQNTGIFDYLRQLLPRDLDTADLLIILLLLLMSGDGQDDQNTALLTLVLYLFL